MTALSGKMQRQGKRNLLLGDLESLADENTVLIKRTLRSGQSVSYHGHVVILGDVNPGAEVSASGNIIVVGVLRGVVHAGMEGDEDAFVLALSLQPTQLRIAGHITRPPDDEKTNTDWPEMARIKEGIVTIETFWSGGERHQ